MGTSLHMINTRVDEPETGGVGVGSMGGREMRRYGRIIPVLTRKLITKDRSAIIRKFWIWILIFETIKCVDAHGFF
jgi:hypothetical protein